MKRYFAPYTKARTWAGTLHLLLDLPLGIAWFTIVVVGLSLGVGLIVLALIGLFVLAGTVFAGRLIDDYLRKVGIRPKERYELDGLELIGRPRAWRFAAAGLGVSVA